MTRPSASRLNRWLTGATVGLLLLNAVLLGLLAARSEGRGRLAFALASLLSCAAVGVIRVLWRRHLQTLSEVARVREELKHEARALRDLLPRE